MFYVTQDDALVDGAESQVWNRLEVARLMEKLNDKERFVITKRLEGHTLYEIGGMCGVGAARVRQILMKAFRIMRGYEYRWEKSAHYLMCGTADDFVAYCERPGFAPASDHRILTE